MTDAADQVGDLYRRHAEAWAVARSSFPGEHRWVGRFAAMLIPGAPVLDIGCGAGQPVASWLAESGHPVTGIDSAAEMIALFRTNLPGAQAEVADMRTLQLNATFGGLVAWDSFFHLTPDDQRQMFSVFRNHAAPGAALLFTSGPGAGEVMGTFEGEPLYHASLEADEYRALLEQHGFDVVAHGVHDPECGGHTVWLARQR